MKAKRCVAEDLIQEGVNKGLPKLDFSGKYYSFFEFWPAWVFYLPVGVYWLLLGLWYRNLSLPLIANPKIYLAGMVGESKSELMQSAGKKSEAYCLPFIEGFKQEEHSSSDGDNFEKAVEQFALPFVIKPDLGCRGAGVRLIKERKDFDNYMASFPVGRKYLIQKIAPFAAEAGVFYVREPDKEKGRVISITLKYRATIIGDGKQSARQLLHDDPRAQKLLPIYEKRLGADGDRILAKGEEMALGFAGSHCRGAIFRDGREYITTKLEEKIDVLMKDFPDFHYGRLDIKFRDMLSLQAGEDMVVIEVNGASSEATHIWDARIGFFEALTTLLNQYRLLFRIGKKVQTQGYKTPSLFTLLRVWLRELSNGANYPSTD